MKWTLEPCDKAFHPLSPESDVLDPPTPRRPWSPGASAEVSVCSLHYRPPLAWNTLLEFLRTHALHGVEIVEGQSYARTLQLAQRRGWVRVRPGVIGELKVECSHSLSNVFPHVLIKLRHLFDLDACPITIDDRLGDDPRFQESITHTPGVRVPRCVDGFELAWRTVLGQQVSVAAATKIAGRTVEALGERVETPIPGLHRLSPTPRQFLSHQSDTLGPLGWLRSRVRAVHALAQAVIDGSLSLSPEADPHEVKARLCALPGIGPWTAGYIAMRALSWSDGWPTGDAILKKRLQGQLHPEPHWRPWSSYAAMRLWYQPQN